MNLSCINSLALLNNTGVLIKICFYKKKGNGKVFFNNFFENSFFISLKKNINFIKFNFKIIYNIIKFYNIYIKIFPNNYIFKYSSITSALFLNFFCLFLNIKINKKVIILGDIDNYGNFLNINDISKKINILNHNYFIIIPSNIYINSNLIKKIKNKKILIIKVSNIFDLFFLFKINIFGCLAQR